MAIAILIATVPLAGCASSSPDADSDGDGLTDVFESAERAVAINGADGVVVQKFTSDSLLPDTDGDGLTDFEEAKLGTNPRLADSDGDGLTDKEEAGLCADVNAATHYDSDRPLPDGLSDAEELGGWSITVRGVERHVASDPCHPDADSDAVNDLDEKRSLTDPNSNDTDSDGILDGMDVDPVWDLVISVTLNVARADSSSLPEGSPVTVELRTDVATQSDNMSLKPAPGTPYGRNVQVGDAGPRGGAAPRTIIVFASDVDGRLLNVSSGANPSYFQLTFDLTSGRARWATTESPEGAGFTSGSDLRVDFVIKTART